MSAGTEEGSRDWERVGRHEDSQQGMFLTPEEVSSPVMSTWWKSAGKRKTQTAETNRGLLQPGFLAV